MKVKTLAASFLFVAFAVLLVRFVQAPPSGAKVAEAATASKAAASAKKTETRKTEAAIQTLIDQAAANGGGEANVAAGKYYLSKTIVVKSGVTLRLNASAMLIPVRNVNVLELKRNSAVFGGIIYAYEMKGYDRSAIFLHGSEHFSGTLSTASIADMKIIGPQGSGNGIFFYAAEDSDHVSWVQARNLNISGFEKAIYFKTEPVQGSDKIWINGNNFSQIHIKDSIYGIYLDGHRDLPYEISGNQFSDVQIQTTPSTKQAIYVTGTKNMIQAMIWDYHNGAEAVHFGRDSLRNQIQSNVLSQDSAYVDEGQQNRNWTNE